MLFDWNRYLKDPSRDKQPFVWLAWCALGSVWRIHFLLSLTALSLIEYCLLKSIIHTKLLTYWTEPVKVEFYLQLDPTSFRKEPSQCNYSWYSRLWCRGNKYLICKHYQNREYWHSISILILSSESNRQPQSSTISLIYREYQFEITLSALSLDPYLIPSFPWGLHYHSLT